jgi:hypothetical protein
MSSTPNSVRCPLLCITRNAIPGACHESRTEKLRLSQVPSDSYVFALSRPMIWGLRKPVEARGNGTKAPAAWAQIIDDYMLPSPRPGNRQPRRNCAESNWFGWPETSAAVRPMLPGRSSSNGSGGRPDGRSKRAAATAPASADSSGGHTEPSGCPTIWPTSCPRYASNVGNAGAAAGARPPMKLFA